MANRIGFREFLNKLNPGQEVQLIVDANVLIASRDKKHKDNKFVREFIEKLSAITNEVTFFTTVTTKAEFLEYYRRKILTESILDIYNKNKVNQIISDAAKLEIEKQVRARNQRQNREIEKQSSIRSDLNDQWVEADDLDVEEFSIDANYFRDSEIKAIKKSFRGRDVQNEQGWISFCEDQLLEKIHAFEKLLDEMCFYLTTRDEVSKKYFVKNEIEWRMATQICGETGMGYSDAMILNMANHTTIKHILTLDFDLIYGGHISSKDKILLTPTERLKNYKNVLKGT